MSTVFLIGKADESDDTPEAMYFSMDAMRYAVSAYLSAMKTGTTAEYCACTWAVHPEDIHLPATSTRRMRLIVEHELCPVHTFEGRLLYFFTWLTERWESENG